MDAHLEAVGDGTYGGSDGRRPGQHDCPVWTRKEVSWNLYCRVARNVIGRDLRRVDLYDVLGEERGWLTS